MKNTVRPEAVDSFAPIANGAGQVSFVLAGKWLFKPGHQTIERAGQLFTLRKKNVDVLMTLINFNNQTVTTEKLYQDVWQGKCVSEGVIKRSICDLRNIFDDHDKSLIVTIPKAGYRLSTSVEKQLSTDQDSNITYVTPRKNPQIEPETVATSYDATASLADKSSEPLQYHGLKNILIMGITMTVTLVVCLAVYYSLLRTKPDVMKPHSASSFVINELINLTKNKSEAVEVLHSIAQKLAAIDKKNPQYNTAAYQLIGAYLHIGLYQEAVAVNSMLIRDSETVFGIDNKKTISVRHLMIDTLMAAGQKQTAFDSAQHTLEINLRYHPQDKALLANSYYYIAQVNLACFYPHCDRVDALRNGLKSINKTIELLTTIEQLNTVAAADALLLKNWFISDGSKKIELVTRALAIYQDKLGKYDHRNAEALFQLGKIEAIWYKSYVKAINHIKQAHDIVSLLSGENYSGVDRIKRELSRIYLYAGQFVNASDYLKQIEQPNDNQFACATTHCLGSLLTLAKAYLYIENHDAAKMTARQINNSLQLNVIKVSFALSQELSAIVMRIHQFTGADRKTPKQILADIGINEGSGMTSQNGISVYVVSHELHNQLLLIAPQLMDSQRYVEILSLMIQTEYNTYTSPPDRHFLTERALKNCANHSQALCRLIKRQLKKR